jgi:hypothetical protein
MFSREQIIVALEKAEKAPNVFLRDTPLEIEKEDDGYHASITGMLLIGLLGPEEAFKMTEHPVDMYDYIAANIPYDIFTMATAYPSVKTVIDNLKRVGT